jgi:hypothetical protein
MNEEDSMGNTPFHNATETELPSDLMNSLLGKLKLFCPTLFSSLTLWENEALETSGWLLRSTSSSKGAFEGGLGFVGPVKELLILFNEVGKPPNLAFDHLATTCSTLPSSLLAGTHLISVTQVGESRDSVSTSNPPLLVLNESLLEPGFRELEEDETSLNTVLESLISFIRDNKEAIKLPTFLGRKCLNPVES